MITVTSSVVCASVFLALLGVQALFVSSAVAIKRSKSAKLRAFARAGRKSARYARIILIHSDRFLAAAQIGVFICAVGLGLFIACVWQTTNGTLQSGTLLTKNFILVGLIILLLSVSLVVTQVIRSVANSFPETVLCIVSRSFIVSAILLAPFVAVVRRSSSLVAHIFGLKRIMARRSTVSPEELTELVAMSSDAGQIEEAERDMIERVFSLSERNVAEVMTPRADIIFVHENESTKQVLKVFAEERVSRILIVGKDLDEVRGVLLAKDLIPFLIQGAGIEKGELPSSKNETVQVAADSMSHGEISAKASAEPEKLLASLKSLMRKPVFVSGDKKVDEVLSILRNEALHMAVVLDEHGGVHGLVTLEDLIEELIGEISDEYDAPSASVGITRKSNGDLIIDASMSIESLNEALNLGIRTGEYSTLAGYLLNAAGRIPVTGEKIKVDGKTFVVEESEQNRVQKVRIIRFGKSRLTKDIARQVSRIATKSAPIQGQTNPATKRIASADKLI